MTPDIVKLRDALPTLEPIFDRLELQLVDDPAWDEPNDTSYLSEADRQNPDIAANVEAMAETNRLIAWFGRDAEGYLGLWRGPKMRSLSESPVVRLDSEGQYSIVAATVPEYLAIAMPEDEFATTRDTLTAAGFKVGFNPDAIWGALDGFDDDPNAYRAELYERARVARGLPRTDVDEDDGASDEDGAASGDEDDRMTASEAADAGDSDEERESFEASARDDDGDDDDDGEGDEGNDEWEEDESDEEDDEALSASDDLREDAVPTPTDFAAGSRPAMPIASQASQAQFDFEIEDDEDEDEDEDEEAVADAGDDEEGYAEADAGNDEDEDEDEDQDEVAVADTGDDEEGFTETGDDDDEDEDEDGYAEADAGDDEDIEPATAPAPVKTPAKTAKQAAAKKPVQKAATKKPAAKKAAAKKAAAKKPAAKKPAAKKATAKKPAKKATKPAAKKAAKPAAKKAAKPAAKKPAKAAAKKPAAKKPAGKKKR